MKSTEIPKAMLKTSIVDAFNGIEKKPIKPAVRINGRRFGINEIIIILNDLNINAIKNEINKIASDLSLIHI